MPRRCEVEKSLFLDNQFNYIWATIKKEIYIRNPTASLEETSEVGVSGQYL